MTSRLLDFSAPEDRADILARHPLIAASHEYWHSKGGASGLPPRRALDPTEMLSFLDRIVLMDVLNGGEDFRHSLVGHHVASSYGRPLRGVTMRQLLVENPSVRPIFEAMRRCVALRLPSMSEQRFLSGRGTHRYALSFMLPLGPDPDGPVTDIFSIGVYLEDAGQVLPAPNSALRPPG